MRTAVLAFRLPAAKYFPQEFLFLFLWHSVSVLIFQLSRPAHQPGLPGWQCCTRNSKHIETVCLLVPWAGWHWEGAVVKDVQSFIIKQEVRDQYIENKNCSQGNFYHMLIMPLRCSKAENAAKSPNFFKMWFYGKHHYLKVPKIFFISQDSGRSNNKTFELIGEKKLSVKIRKKCSNSQQ